MVSSLTLGIAAASFVLFVPLALAGLHLTRNKLLFFSASLFISLAVFIHLSPFLPSLSLSLSLPRPLAVGPTPPLPLPLSCLSSLPSSISFSQESSSFSFRSQTTCNLVKFSNLNALLLLNGSSVTIIGDSQSRLMTLSLLDLLLVDPTSVHDALFRRHSDYHLHIPSHSITVSFLWAPFEDNISHALTFLNDNYPDVIVAGSGLWHMLHVTDSTLYGQNLARIRDSAKKVEKNSNSNSHLFWLGLPALVEEMLNTEEKRARMNGTMQGLYNEEVERSGLLRRDVDDGPFLLLDVGELSRGCGRRCAVDGMHYDKVVYDAAVQIMLNALLIETRQGI